MGSLTASTSTDPPGGGPRTPSEITYDGKTYNIAREGMAEILDLKREKDPTSTKNEPQSVFYNPIQQYNRDLSVLAIKVFGEDLAAIRKHQHERREERLAQGKQRGQKRKRPQDGGRKDAEEPVATKNKVDEAAIPPDSAVNGVDLMAESASTQYEAPLTEADGSTQVKGPREVRDDANKEDDMTNGHGIDGVPIDNGTKKGADSHTGRPSFRILDALSATGLRALRYAKEIPMATTITANDHSSSATASIKLNAEHNKLSAKISPTTSNAIEHMHRAAARAATCSMQYNVIDLDPYGTAAPFLDAAVRAIVNGGLLCVTCTDAGVFASHGYLEKTYSQYGGLPLKGPHAHEGGVRLILHAIATSAARYGLAIEPLLSLSIDFYARVFVRIHHSPAEVKFLASKTMVVYNCDAGCGAWAFQHLARAREKRAKNGDMFYNFSPALAPSANTHCEHCGFKTHQAGPMWGGPLHNPHFIQRILDMLPTLDKSIYGTIPRIQGMLSVALNETLEHAPSSSTEPGTSEPVARPIPPSNPASRAHHPFSFLPSALSRVLHCVSPSDAAIRGALMGLGYRTTCSHTKAGSICTDAPWSVIWEVMREWIRQMSPIKEGVLKQGTAGWAIMRKDRGNAMLMGAKNKLRQALENDTITDMAGLKKEVEAVLYRLSKPEEQGKEGENAHGDADGGAESQSTNNAARPAETGVVPDTETENREDGPRDAHPKKLKIVFDEKLGREPQRKRMVRYQPNPRPDWGPMNKARG
ncbi:MAG: RNA methyltransferase tRNA(m5U54)methyltransferase [Alectoria fallacina]|uniref:tRNA (guanine(26)-N(2))-dimethyltransferase n=1 Tax=Alectoria fallacina TaxID=1903189 RepID=A0A8H3G100_9LECA|nr:MAG: RNA methyltransferase tRNA(m5U54)methyltransferase [Alectoria fallacina]